jgi:hypothetical protein
MDFIYPDRKTTLLSGFTHPDARKSVFTLSRLVNPEGCGF